MNPHQKYTIFKATLHLGDATQLELAVASLHGHTLFYLCLSFENQTNFISFQQLIGIAKKPQQNFHIKFITNLLSELKTKPTIKLTN